MKILIKVTEEILHKAKDCGILIKGPETYASRNCGIALAVREIFPEASVTDRKIYPISRGVVMKCLPSEVIPLPRRAQAFVRLFDYLDPYKRTQMKPFSFEIELPTSLISTIGIGEVYKVLSESKTLELVEI